MYLTSQYNPPIFNLPVFNYNPPVFNELSKTHLYLMGQYNPSVFNESLYVASCVEWVTITPVSPPVFTESLLPTYPHLCLMSH